MCPIRDISTLYFSFILSFSYITLYASSRLLFPLSLGVTVTLCLIVSHSPCQIYKWHKMLISTLILCVPLALFSFFPQFLSAPLSLILSLSLFHVYVPLHTPTSCWQQPYLTFKKPNLHLLVLQWVVLSLGLSYTMAHLTMRRKCPFIVWHFPIQNKPQWVYEPIWSILLSLSQPLCSHRSCMLVERSVHLLNRLTKHNDGLILVSCIKSTSAKI